MSKQICSWLIRATAFGAPLLLGCSHELQIRNLDLYAVPVRLSSLEQPANVAVLPFTGQQDSVFYFNALVDRLSASPLVGELRTDYLASKTNSFQPDLILSINPSASYRSSGWNFLVNWPGFLIFTPAWNGYVYHADVLTQIVIHDGTGRALSEASIPMSYSIRQAEMDRTIFTGLTWFEVSALAFFGGIYNAFVFDRDIVGQFQVQIKDNYATYVSNQVQPKVQAAADAIRPAPEVSLPAVGSGFSEAIAPPATEAVNENETPDVRNY